MHPEVTLADNLCDADSTTHNSVHILHRKYCRYRGRNALACAVPIGCCCSRARWLALVSSTSFIGFTLHTQVLRTFSTQLYRQVRTLFAHVDVQNLDLSHVRCYLDPLNTKAGDRLLLLLLLLQGLGGKWHLENHPALASATPDLHQLLDPGKITGHAHTTISHVLTSKS